MVPRWMQSGRSFATTRPGKSFPPIPALPTSRLSPTSPTWFSVRWPRRRSSPDQPLVVTAPSRAYLGRDLQKMFIVPSRCSQLHAAGSAGNRDYRNAAQAERRGVPQDARAGLAMIGARREPRHRRRRHQQQFMFGKQCIDPLPKYLVQPARNAKLRLIDSCAPLQPFAQAGIKFAEMPRVDARRFIRLDRRIDLKRLRPPTRVEMLAPQPERLQFVRNAVQRFHNLRLAIIQKSLVDHRKPRKRHS